MNAKDYLKGRRTDGADANEGIECSSLEEVIAVQLTRAQRRVDARDEHIKGLNAIIDELMTAHRDLAERYGKLAEEHAELVGKRIDEVRDAIIAAAPTPPKPLN